MAYQHPNVLNFTPPSLYSPSPARRGPRHFDVTWNQDDDMMKCPVPLREKWRPHQGSMRKHFCFRHYDQGVSFNGDTRSYEKCELCMKYIQPKNEARHQRTVLCRKGNERRQKRARITAALLPAPTFYIDETPLERVPKFRYLGRILSPDDHDLSACVRTIQRSNAKWAAISKVLQRE